MLAAFAPEAEASGSFPGTVPLPLHFFRKRADGGWDPIPHCTPVPDMYVSMAWQAMWRWEAQVQCFNGQPSIHCLQLACRAGPLSLMAVLQLLRPSSNTAQHQRGSCLVPDYFLEPAHLCLLLACHPSRHCSLTDASYFPTLQVLAVRRPALLHTSTLGHPADGLSRLAQASLQVSRHCPKASLQRYSRLSTCWVRRAGARRATRSTAHRSRQQSTLHNMLGRPGPGRLIKPGRRQKLLVPLGG